MKKIGKLLVLLISKLIRISYKILVFSIFIFLFMSIVDYIQVVKGDKPVFIISHTMNEKRIDTFQGFFHSVTRKVYASPKESLKSSSNVKFSIFTIEIPITYQKEVHEESLQVEVKEKEECKDLSKLYYADLNQKIYTYCLDSIEVDKKDLSKLLEKDKDIIDKIESNLSYHGFSTNNLSLEFTSNTINIYHCHNKGIEDIYIGSNNMTFQKDFCTYKDDDLKYIFDILDETPDDLEKLRDDNGKVIPETFYEDDKFIYQFTLPKSKYVFIITPEIRGRKEQKINIKEVLNKKLLTIEDLKNKGLEFYTKEK